MTWHALASSIPLHLEPNTRNPKLSGNDVTLALIVISKCPIGDRKKKQITPKLPGNNEVTLARLVISK
jgi:hypothetical protein